MANERSRGRAIGSFAAFIRTRERVGGGVAAGRVGAAFRLQPGRVSAAVRSQRELGFPATGAGRAFAGRDPAAGTRRPDRGAGGHEVSGAGGAAKSGRLPAHGGDLRRSPLRYARSRPAICRLATRIGYDPPTHSGGSRAVFQNAEAGAGPGWAGCRTDPRSRDGERGGESRPSAAGWRGGGGVGWGATRRGAAADRAH